jgi:hypothetical protein
VEVITPVEVVVVTAVPVDPAQAVVTVGAAAATTTPGLHRIVIRIMTVQNVVMMMITMINHVANGYNIFFCRGARFCASTKKNIISLSPAPGSPSYRTES